MLCMVQIPGKKMFFFLKKKKLRKSKKARTEENETTNVSIWNTPRIYVHQHPHTKVKIQGKMPFSKITCRSL
jgi:hypothetical protein